MTDSYPETSRSCDSWILAARGPRNQLNPHRPYSFLVEKERSESGDVVPIATVFLTNRECPFRCLMCDLWQNTLTWSVPPGTIPEQIDYALWRLPASREIKFYNNGSFFDPNAVPMEDYEAIAERLQDFERVIVESHPAFINDACLLFRDLLGRRGNIQLEVAIGLETVHPKILEKLNKHMTLEAFAHSASMLRRNEIALRVFVLVQPPFMDLSEALHWTTRSIDFAFDTGATVTALIPTRPGNGALDALARLGDFSPPKLSMLEDAVAYGIGIGRGRLFADLWNLEEFGTCDSCLPGRKSRLHQMNLQQTILPLTLCETCGYTDGKKV